MSWLVPNYTIFTTNSKSLSFQFNGQHHILNQKIFSGIAYDFFKNNKLRHLTFIWKGKNIGTEYYWHSNGVVSAMQPYKNGFRHGYWKQWYPDGSVRARRQFIRGKIENEFWAWHANGQVSDFRYYKNNTEIAYKSFINDGKPFYNYVYQDGLRVGLQGGNYCKTQLEKRL